MKLFKIILLLLIGFPFSNITAQTEFDEEAAYKRRLEMAEKIEKLRNEVAYLKKQLIEKDKKIKELRQEIIDLKTRNHYLANMDRQKDDSLKYQTLQADVYKKLYENERDRNDELQNQIKELIKDKTKIESNLEYTQILLKESQSKQYAQLRNDIRKFLTQKELENEKVMILWQDANNNNFSIRLNLTNSFKTLKPWNGIFPLELLSNNFKDTLLIYISEMKAGEKYISLQSLEKIPGRNSDQQIKIPYRSGMEDRIDLYAAPELNAKIKKGVSYKIRITIKNQNNGQELSFNKRIVF